MVLLSKEDCGDFKCCFPVASCSAVGRQRETVVLISPRSMRHGNERSLQRLSVGIGQWRQQRRSPLGTVLSGRRLRAADPLVVEIDEIAAGSFKHREPPVIKGSGYVVKSLEAALWAFDRSNSFREGCLLAVNLGDDADTTGAVYGQIAGAFYGESGIPGSWKKKLALRETIESFADKLCDLCVSRI